MKKLIYAAAFLALGTLQSCVVSDSTDYKRTSGNLAGYTEKLVRKTVFSSVVTLNGMSDGELSEEKKVYCDDSGLMLTVSPVGASSWMVVSTGAETEFSMHVSRTPDEVDGFYEWVCTGFTCTCSDPGGYTVNLVSDGAVGLDWNWYDGSGHSDYYLEQTGSYRAEFCLDGESIDWCELLYTNGTLRYSTSQGR